MGDPFLATYLKVGEPYVQLIFLNRFFYPDQSATSQMLTDLAFGLARRGWQVVVITSRQRYDAPLEPLLARESVAGVRIVRIWTSSFGRANLFGRLLDYLTFYLSASVNLWRRSRRHDVVIAKTDPPMLSIIAAPICRLRGARLVNWLQDIFPETAQSLGVGGALARFPYTLLRTLRNRSLRAATANVVLGERMSDHLLALGVPHPKIQVIANWADGVVVVPIAHSDNRLRSAWGLGGAFVVAYSGNLGRAHEIETLLQAMIEVEQMARAANSPSANLAQKVRWLFIGSGAQFGSLQDLVARHALRSVRFEPYQNREDLALSLSAGDVHLVSLLPQLEGLIVPSKFYGICAAGRPTLFIGAQDGEIALLIGQYGCGRRVEPGAGARLAATVMELAGKRDLCELMGRRARAAFDADFDRTRAITRWDALLRGVVGDQTPVASRAVDRDPVRPRTRDRR